MTEYAFEGAKRSSASISWSFATQTLATDAAYPFSNVIAAAYQGVVLQAFARWASVSGLTFTQVADSATVPIRVGFQSFTSAGELGETDYRYSRGILANDTLVRLLDPATAPVTTDANGNFLYSTYNNISMYQVALHEIGHALGLGHTTDPATVMYPYATAANGDLATGDIEGINTLYPYFTVAAVNPIQVEGGAGTVDTYQFVFTRHDDPSVALTMNYAVTGAAYPTLTGSAAATASEFVGGAFPSGQLNIAAGASTATISIAVAGNATAQPDQGFAITLSSPSALDSVTVRGAVNAVALDDDGYGQVTGNALGLYRFFDTADGTHFYSASETERNTLILTRPDLTYEGFGLTAVAAPATDPAAAAIYRFFETTNGTHFYSASATERDTIFATRPDLTYEGIAFYEHTTPQTGDAAVYRFFDLVDGTHFYTSSATERASILATRPDLRAEGIGFYAPTA